MPEYTPISDNPHENVKTLADCARCPLVSLCDAHITNGEWKHRSGVNPCKVIL